MTDEYCLECGVPLSAIDNDPNEGKNTICARCHAQNCHDFDAEPQARYDRRGRRVDTPVGGRLLCYILKEFGPGEDYVTIYAAYGPERRAEAVKVLRLLKCGKLARSCGFTYALEELREAQ